MWSNSLIFSGAGTSYKIENKDRKVVYNVVVGFALYQSWPFYKDNTSWVQGKGEGHRARGWVSVCVIFRTLIENSILIIDESCFFNWHFC